MSPNRGITVTAIMALTFSGALYGRIERPLLGCPLANRRHNASRVSLRAAPLPAAVITSREQRLASPTRQVTLPSQGKCGSADAQQIGGEMGKGITPIRIHDPINDYEWKLFVLGTELAGKEIEMTDENVEQVMEMRKDLEVKLHKVLERTKWTGPDDHRKRNYNQEMIDAAEPFKVRLGRLLSPWQADRLQEILFQECGPSILFLPQVKRDLGLSDEQQKKIGIISHDFTRKRSALLNEFGTETSENDSEKRRAQKNEFLKTKQAINNDALNRMIDVLTPEQAGYLKNIRGREIDLTVLEAQLDAAAKKPVRPVRLLDHLWSKNSADG